MVAPRSTETDAQRAIVAAAMRLFAAHGFDGTALQDVATAVGVSKPAVLHHYPSKEHLREAVLGAILAHWKETLPTLLLAATASEARFESVFGELHRFFAQDRDRALVVLREVIDRPAESKKLMRAAVRPWLTAIAEYIRAGQGTGRHFADVDAEAYVLHVMQFVISAAAASPVTSGVLDGDVKNRYDRELARIARTALFTPRPAPPPISPRNIDPDGAAKKGGRAPKRQP
jgi:TetR/AcrR family transcriptional regulator